MENIKEYVLRQKNIIKSKLEVINTKLKLVIIQVGNNAASNAYVNGKIKDCTEVNLPCDLIHLEETISEQDLLSLINTINNDPAVTGFIVQLPLPKHISEEKIIEAINPDKDVDGFSKRAIVNPATPQGIIDYLIDNGIDFTDKNAVVIGRSNIVGKPIARLLLEKNCNVVQLHSKTSEENKRLFLKDADIIIVATGHRNTITTDYKLKDSCILIDVGMNRNDEGKLCGDVEEQLPIACQSPVPGGVGLLTRLALVNNLIRLS